MQWAYGLSKKEIVTIKNAIEKYGDFRIAENHRKSIKLDKELFYFRLNEKLPRQILQPTLGKRSFFFLHIYFELYIENIKS